MCVHESKFCNGIPDCTDSTDELFCNIDCDMDEEFKCHRYVNLSVKYFATRWQIPDYKLIMTQCCLLFRDTKMESALFVLSKLTFSGNLRCLSLLLLVGVVYQKRSLSSTFLLL